MYFCSRIIQKTIVYEKEYYANVHVADAFCSSAQHSSAAAPTNQQWESALAHPHRRVEQGRPTEDYRPDTRRY